MKPTRVLLAAMVTAVVVCAQPLGGPGLGLIYDSDSVSVRGIVGLPGAAYLGSPVDAGFAISSAAVSPSQDYALAVRSGDGAVFLIRILSSGASVSVLDGVSSSSGRFAISPRGSAAVVCGDSCGTITLITGLPAAPAITTGILTPVGGAPVTAIAVGDDGAILTAQVTSDGSKVYLLSTSTARLVATGQQISSIAFIAGKSAALLADSAAGEVSRIDDVWASASLSSIAGSGATPYQPMRVAVSSSGQRAFVLDAASQSILTVDLGSNTLAAAYHCDCTPDRLEKLNGDGVFRLTGHTSEPTWVLDSDDRGGRIVFIPAAAGPVSETNP